MGWLTLSLEADVFMAERSYADIARNELVSSKPPLHQSPPTRTNISPQSLPPRTRILQRNHLPNHQLILHNRRRLPFPRQHPSLLLPPLIHLSRPTLAEILRSTPR